MSVEDRHGGLYRRLRLGFALRRVFAGRISLAPLLSTAFNSAAFTSRPSRARVHDRHVLLLYVPEIGQRAKGRARIGLWALAPEGLEHRRKRHLRGRQ